MTDLDLFSCAGGATTGIAMLGREVVGIDHDPDACATHAAAGHPTIRADLTAPVPVSGPFDLVWASPPCTAFSMAGKGAGREVADVLIGRILAENWEPMDGYDPTVWLILPTMAALLSMHPVAVAMENVPPTLPVMHACAQVLERHGWHTAVGVLSAERFGVAQTRKRAFLIANRDRRVAMPEPTHQGYGDEPDDAQGALFGEPLLPWISMADALGWRVPEHRKSAGQDGCSTNRPVSMDRRTISRGPGGTKVPTVDVPVTSPSPSLTSSGLKGQFVWVTERPSTTLVSSFRPDVVAGPGYRQAGDGPRQDAPGSISISISEAARLQAFPNGHPWQGLRIPEHVRAGRAVKGDNAASDQLKSDMLQRGVRLVVLPVPGEDDEVVEGVVELVSVDVVDNLARLRPGDEAVLRLKRGVGEGVAAGDTAAGPLGCPLLVRVESITVEHPLLVVPGAEPSRLDFAFAVLARPLRCLPGEAVDVVADPLVVHEAHAPSGVLPVAAFDVTETHRSKGYRKAGSSRTSIFRQVGNAVPPPVAAAVAGAALGIDWRPAVASYLTELYSQALEREVAA